MGRKHRVKKLKASVVATPESQKAPGPSKSPGRGRPKKPVPKNLLRGKYKVNYNHRHLQDALLEVKNGTMSERAASKAFGVPRSTLKDRIGEVTREVAGRPPVLSDDE